MPLNKTCHPWTKLDILNKACHPELVSGSIRYICGGFWNKFRMTLFFKTKLVIPNSFRDLYAIYVADSETSSEWHYFLVPPRTSFEVLHCIQKCSSLYFRFTEFTPSYIRQISFSPPPKVLQFIFKNLNINWSTSFKIT